MKFGKKAAGESDIFLVKKSPIKWKWLKKDAIDTIKKNGKNKGQDLPDGKATSSQKKRVVLSRKKN